MNIDDFIKLIEIELRDDIEGEIKRIENGLEIIFVDGSTRKIIIK